MCVEYMHVMQAEIAVEYLMWGSGGEAGYMPPLLPASRRIQKVRPTNENDFLHFTYSIHCKKFKINVRRNFTDATIPVAFTWLSPFIKEIFG
jgi:hypothetical protein